MKIFNLWLSSKQINIPKQKKYTKKITKEVSSQTCLAHANTERYICWAIVIR